jgi:LysM repeat protein/ABC-type branched-subunit amino acid transport system substrate-binding protein
MRFFRFLLVFSVFSVLFIYSNAQELKENEIVVIKGEKFVLHQVRTGETIYSISKQFKIERLQLLKYNPKISEGLNIGEILKIPYRNGVDISDSDGSQKGDPTRFEIYKVKARRETPYFIATKFGITVEELFAYNPKVRKFKRRKEVRIPIWGKAKVKIGREEENAVPDASTDRIIVHGVVSGETLFSISKKYGVAESEIIFLNPEAKKLKAGAHLNIPQKAGAAVVVDSIETRKYGRYFEHIIGSGETLWGTTRKYKVSEEELLVLNPVLKNSFQVGVVIKIPLKKEVEETQAKPINEKAFKKHFVEWGETLYGLAAKYSLTIPEIKKYNPVLKTRNLVAGETILIPQKITDELVQFEVENSEDSTRQVEAFYAVEEPFVEIPEPCKKNELNSFQNEIFNVALFLPLFLEANDTLNRETIVIDSLMRNGERISRKNVETGLGNTIEKEEAKELFKQFYRNTESFVEFYEGVLLAVDSMQNRGMNIRLHVFDTQRSTDSIRNFIYSVAFLETDLIIGPVYERVQKEVAEIAAKNRIPIVSPLASQSMIAKHNPCFFQAVPSREYIAERTAEMVADEYFNSNFIVLKTTAYEGTPEGRLVELIQEKLYNSGFLSNPTGVSFTVYNFKNEGSFGLSRILSHNKENVVYIPSSKEGELSVAISNLNNLSDDYSITLIGSNRYQNYHSIDVEQFHNLKLKYIAPYWINYKNQATIEFLAKYRRNFKTEPGRIGVQGFDVAFYFLNALKYFGKDFGECLPYLHVNLVQGNYHFEKVSKFGGFMNQGVSVVSYTSNYKVRRTRVIPIAN